MAGRGGPVLGFAHLTYEPQTVENSDDDGNGLERAGWQVDGGTHADRKGN